MSVASPVWPSQLDHLRIDSDVPSDLADFYAAALGMSQTALPDDTVLLHGPGRRLVVGRGRPGDRPYHGFRLQSRDQLRAVRVWLEERELPLEKSPSSVFEPDAVAVRDPDGWLNVFGLPRDDLPAAEVDGARPSTSRPARLQHVVVASSDLGRMADFYEGKLGFAPSDYCDLEVGNAATRRAAFYRTDPEHHSFAIFHASEVRADHHAYETSCWNDIRDWADHLADFGVPIWWGPGRHGPGNNLFFMVKDPHGHQLELSAELEQLDRDAKPRLWPMGERALNLWGPGWIRD